MTPSRYTMGQDRETIAQQGADSSRSTFLRMSYRRLKKRDPEAALKFADRLDDMGRPNGITQSDAGNANSARAVVGGRDAMASMLRQSLTPPVPPGAKPAVPGQKPAGAPPAAAPGTPPAPVPPVEDTTAPEAAAAPGAPQKSIGGYLDDAVGWAKKQLGMGSSAAAAPADLDRSGKPRMIDGMPAAEWMAKNKGRAALPSPDDAIPGGITTPQQDDLNSLKPVYGADGKLTTMGQAFPPVKVAPRDDAPPPAPNLADEDPNLITTSKGQMSRRTFNGQRPLVPASDDVYKEMERRGMLGSRAQNYGRPAGRRSLLSFLRR